MMAAAKIALIVLAIAAILIVIAMRVDAVRRAREEEADRRERLSRHGVDQPD